MNRFPALLLCAGLATAVMAAPAPAPRPSRVWAEGWNEPEGDCRFNREGDKLTADVAGGCQAKMLRDMDGDFTVQMRVDGGFPNPGEKGEHWAGFLAEGKGGWVVHFYQTALYVSGEKVAGMEGRIRGQSHDQTTFDNTPERPAYLRLDRRNDRV